MLARARANAARNPTPTRRGSRRITETATNHTEAGLRRWPWVRRGAKTRRAAPQQGQIRLALICALFLGCALVIVWRLYTFQVVETDWYQQMAQEERQAEIPILPTRGSLLDTNGSPLAISVPLPAVDLSEKKLNPPLDALLNALPLLLNVPLPAVELL